MASEGTSQTEDFKPKPRPQSTIALNFSAALDSAFDLKSPKSDEITGLAHSVEQKKQAVTSQSEELQALEEKLRETEERLKKSAAKGSVPAGGSKKI